MFSSATRQFLPGYFQPRLPALAPRHIKIDVYPLTVPAKCLLHF
jgi:hypothetical protein